MWNMWERTHCLRQPTMWKGGNHKCGKRETTKEGKGITTKADKAEPIRRLSIDLPESWHRRFKTACTKSRQENDRSR